MALEIFFHRVRLFILVYMVFFFFSQCNQEVIIWVSLANLSKAFAFGDYSQWMSCFLNPN